MYCHIDSLRKRKKGKTFGFKGFFQVKDYLLFGPALQGHIVPVISFAQFNSLRTILGKQGEEVLVK